MALNLLQPLSEAERAARLSDWTRLSYPPPTNIPVVVNLQVYFPKYGSITDLSPPILLNALDCVDLDLLKDKAQTSDYYLEKYMGDLRAYEFTIKLKDYEPSVIVVLDGTFAKEMTAATVYHQFLHMCFERGRLLRNDLEAEALRKREWVRRNNKGKVRREEPWAGRGKVYIADIWAEVEVLF